MRCLVVESDCMRCRETYAYFFFVFVCRGHLVGTSSCPYLVSGSIGTHEESYSLRALLYFPSRPGVMLMQSEESIAIMPFSNLGSLP